MQEPARVAIDLGAESCRVSLLRWEGGKPEIEVVHRIANGPVHEGASLHWSLEAILEGLEEGLRKAAQAAPEGIASIGVDSWGVDYVRLAPDGRRCGNHSAIAMNAPGRPKRPRTKSFSPFELYQRTGAFPLRINTVYQLLADPAAGIDARAPWIMMPEFVLYWLGARRVSEYTHATHTGLVDLKTGNWSEDIFRRTGSCHGSRTTDCAGGDCCWAREGTAGFARCIQRYRVDCSGLSRYRFGDCGNSANLGSAAYISSGTWSLVGTLTAEPVTTRVAFDCGYTNLGAATGDLMFHSLMNSMWVMKQCMDSWAAQGRRWKIEDIVDAGRGLRRFGGVAGYGRRDADAGYGDAASDQQGTDTAWV